MKKAIQIIFSSSGEIQIDAVGFKGADCERATRFLEDALGVVSNRVKKPEYHARSTSRSQQKLST
jgi:Protein of unknown function (DUF2997)